MRRLQVVACLLFITEWAVVGAQTNVQAGDNQTSVAVTKSTNSSASTPPTDSRGSVVAVTPSPDQLRSAMTGLSRSMADLQALFQSELKTLTSKMQTFAGLLADVKNKLNQVNARRPDPPANPFRPSLTLPFLSPMGVSNPFLGFNAQALPYNLAALPNRVNPFALAPAADTSALLLQPQPRPPNTTPVPTKTTEKPANQQQNQQPRDFFASLFAGNPMASMLSTMTGIPPPVLPPIPKAPPGVDGSSGMLQSIMGGGSGGAPPSENPNAALIAALTGGGQINSGNPGSLARPAGLSPFQRVAAQAENPDMLMMMSMSGMFA